MCTDGFGGNASVKKPSSPGYVWLIVVRCLLVADENSADARTRHFIVAADGRRRRHLCRCHRGSRTESGRRQSQQPAVLLMAAGHRRRPAQLVRRQSGD